MRRWLIIGRISLIDGDVIMDEKRSFQILRDCFYAGFLVPHWCLKHGWKRPLFICKSPDFLWEISSQILFSKENILAEYCVVDKEEYSNYSVASKRMPSTV